ncbi:hypothetical protein SAMN04488128_102566 [Chitinophaga eiseniae]|uniref:Uncharacterized protein n=1 Tax=Chitinophaga eiseniae TaxID=634771 RepID=A0A1T4QS63_9BACT|nr:hypothetical protein [Chitinophaga eiseniae]SKA06619.1 hypothetical protein SAMN04488128_102566 [Chitinophaga eiseniae]
MDTTKKTGDIEKDSLELVLEEFTDEQKLHTKTVDDLVKAVNGLSGKFIEFEEKLGKLKEIDILTDTKPMQEIVKKGIIDMKLTVAAQPKNVTRKFQLLLFPEQDAKLFYRVVFGRWFLWLVVMLLLTNLYKFSIHWSENRKEIKLQQLENNRIKKAWNTLYSQQGKGIKRLMDSAYNKSGRPE